jgi:hypothetical protein
MRVHLTDARVQALQPRRKRYTVLDGVVPNFGIPDLAVRC